jgi:hypothetical protein
MVTWVVGWGLSLVGRVELIVEENSQAIYEPTGASLRIPGGSANPFSIFEKARIRAKAKKVEISLVNPMHIHHTRSNFHNDSPRHRSEEFDSH